MNESEGAAPQAQSEGISVNAAAEKFAGMFSREREIKAAKKQPRETPEPDTQDDATDPDEISESPEGDEERDYEPEPQPEDEELAEEEGDEDEAPAETDETDDEEEAEAVPSKHKVRVDGKELEVEYDELLAGYSRNADYTRKTQAVAETRKAVEAEAVQVRKQRADYDAALVQIEDALAVMMPQEPDWEAVKRDTPSDYPTLHTDWQRYLAQTAAVKAKRRELFEADAADRRTQFEQRKRDEGEKLLDAIPEWRDPKVREPALTKLAEMARGTYGFTDDEVSAVYDSRMVRMLNDLGHYHELKAKRATVRETVKRTGPGPVRVAKPATSLNRRPTNPAQEAASRLAKSGSVEDATDAFLHRFKAQRKAGRR